VPSKWQQVASNAECETRYSCNTDGTSCACMAAAQAPVPVALCALAALLPARMRLRDTYAVAKSAENFGGIATMSVVETARVTNAQASIVQRVTVNTNLLCLFAPLSPNSTVRTMRQLLRIRTVKEAGREEEARAHQCAV
jgi:hypothetical protein